MTIKEAVQSISNQKLENLLNQFGYNVKVNMITRKTIEGKIVAKLKDYSQEELQDFYNKHIA